MFGRLLAVQCLFGIYAPCLALHGYHMEQALSTEIISFLLGALVKLLCVCMCVCVCVCVCVCARACEVSFVACT